MGTTSIIYIFKAIDRNLELTDEKFAIMEFCVYAVQYYMFFKTAVICMLLMCKYNFICNTGRPSLGKYFIIPLLCFRNVNDGNCFLSKNFFFHHKCHELQNYIFIIFDSTSLVTYTALSVHFESTDYTAFGKLIVNGIT